MLTLRQGLYKSKNMVSIRILQAIGPQYGQDYLTRFGFDKARQPAVLPLALGAARSRRCRWPAPTRCSPTAATASRPT